MYRIARQLLPIVLLLTAASCAKKYTKPDTVPQTPSSPGGPSSFPIVSLNQLLKDFRYTPEENCIPAGLLTTVTLAGGDTLVFYPWSFRDRMADTIITLHTVCIRTTVLHTPADMIMNRTTGSTLQGGMLRVAGHLYIEATMDGVPVKLSQYRVLLKHPRVSTERMDIAAGTVNPTDSLVRWRMIDSVAIGTTALGTDVDTMYVFDSVSGDGWIAATEPFDTATQKADINVYLSAVGLDSKNTAMFLVLPSINCVLPVTYSRYTGYFSLGDDAHKVREGMTAHLVTISRNGANYYYYEQKNLLIKDGMVITATPTLQTSDYIRTSLRAL
ncbi:MAG: hypothetical protein KF744_00785 [Taibaiella sp.]|nr:hypothetical protein [Taibaiella sp.]